MFAERRGLGETLRADFTKSKSLDHEQNLPLILSVILVHACVDIQSFSWAEYFAAVVAWAIEDHNVQAILIVLLIIC